MKTLIIALLVCATLSPAQAQASWGAFFGGLVGGYVVGRSGRSSSTTNITNYNVSMKVDYSAIERAMRNGTADGIEIAYLRIREHELHERMSANHQLMMQTKRAINESLADYEANVANGRVICSSFCGGFNNNGQLSATPVLANGTTRDAAFASLRAQCNGGRELFFELEDRSSRRLGRFQELLTSNKYDVCDVK